MRGYETGSRAVQSYLRSRARISSASADEPVAPPPLSVGALESAQRVSPERAHEVIDLLNPTPHVIVDVERLTWATSFGFSGGDITGVLGQAMRKARVAASDWDADAFISGLFVQHLVRTAMRVRIGNTTPALDTLFITRVITHPPRDADVVDHRHKILAELAGDAALLSRFQSLYTKLTHLRELLDPPEATREIDGRRRRLEILTALRDVLSHMVEGFADCTSGLGRIHRFAQHAIAQPGHGQLLELLDYDEHLARVELKVQLGADGHIRGFAVTRVSENVVNRFHRSSLRRFLSRIVMFWRGLAVGESDIANRWIDATFDGVQHLVPPMLQLLGEMEVYLASLALKDAAATKGLAMCLPELHAPGAKASDSNELHVHAMFNPLLLSQEGAITPCDVTLRRFRATTLVTGPNSGGKTRLLQAIALSQMLGQAGLFVPAAQARMPRASGLFVSLIEEARADQREGRLGTELVRIRKLFEDAQPGSLIVLDELCSGTNPSEGEEIIRLVLSLLGELQACVFITTHFLQFATRLSEERDATQGLCFLQVELNAQQRPTYRFISGVANTSLAHQTAARLGVTREELLQLIEHNRRG